MKWSWDFCLWFHLGPLWYLLANNVFAFVLCFLDDLHIIQEFILQSPLQCVFLYVLEVKFFLLLIIYIEYLRHSAKSIKSMILTYVRTTKNSQIQISYSVSTLDNRDDSIMLNLSISDANSFQFFQVLNYVNLIVFYHLLEEITSICRHVLNCHCLSCLSHKDEAFSDVL